MQKKISIPLFFLIIFQTTFMALNTQAATSLHLPVLVSSGKYQIFQLKDFSTVLQSSQLQIPKTIELNALTDIEEIEEIEQQIQILSNVVNKPLKLVKSADLKTYIDNNLEDKLCYTGNREMALRLFPHFNSDFFPADLQWIGYRFSGESTFKDFSSNETLPKTFLNTISLNNQFQWLTQSMKITDIQILTLNKKTNTIEMQVISMCELTSK